MKHYGLIGKTLKHSFSKKYFKEKFEQLQLTDHTYELYELDDIVEVDELRNKPGLSGFNITLPYKEDIFPYLTSVEDNARKIGAVNVVKVKDNEFHGFNTDYFGFKESLKNWLAEKNNIRALVLGTGGAAKAVSAALDTLDIDYLSISRAKSEKRLTYDSLTDSTLNAHKLIINTTPLGIAPDTESKPELPYQSITSAHYLYDLVYNPLETSFLKEGSIRGAKTKNGLEMLYLQAEKSWEIWNEEL